MKNVNSIDRENPVLTSCDVMSCLFHVYQRLTLSGVRIWSDLNCTPKKKRCVNSFCDYYWLLSFRPYNFGSLRFTFKPALLDALERLVGLPKRTSSFEAAPIRRHAASVRKERSRTRNQRNLPALVCRLNFRDSPSSLLFDPVLYQHAD